MDEGIRNQEPDLLDTIQELPRHKEVFPIGVGVMALDVGRKRIGLAATDEEQEWVIALETYVQQRGEDAVRAIVEIARKREVGVFVLGLPRHLSGELGAMAEYCLKFGNRLGDQSGLPVFFVDERLTSALATRQLQAGGIQPSKQKGLVDQQSAKLMLEEVLAMVQKKP